MNVNTLYVKTQGSFSNRALVLLHAFPLTSEMWNNQMKYFSGSYYTLAPDLPGFGKGVLPDHAFTFEHYVDMVYNFLKETGLKKSVWCGLSMGGYLALRLYERAPELCSGLILCNTKSGADDNAAKLKRWATIKNLHFHHPEFIERQWRAMVGESSQKKMELKQDLKLMIAGNTEEAICSGLAALTSRTDTTEMLSEIKVPTLILAGIEDQIIPVSEAEKMAKAISGSKLVILKKTGHLSNLETCEEFNAAVTKFLTSF